MPEVCYRPEADIRQRFNHTGPQRGFGLNQSLDGPVPNAACPVPRNQLRPLELWLRGYAINEAINCIAPENSPDPDELPGFVRDHAFFDHAKE